MTDSESEEEVSAAELQSKNKLGFSNKAKKAIWAFFSGTAIIGALWGAIFSQYIGKAAGVGDSVFGWLTNRHAVQDVLAKLGKEREAWEEEKRKLLIQISASKTAATAYVILPNRSMDFCYKSIIEFAESKKYAWENQRDNQRYYTVRFNTKDIQVRCVGSSWSDSAFILLTAISEESEELEGLHKEISSYFRRYSLTSELSRPQDTNFIYSGPHLKSGSIKFRSSYSEYKELWIGAKELPAKIRKSLEGDRLYFNTCHEASEQWVCSYIYPRMLISYIVGNVGNLQLDDGRDLYIVNSAGEVEEVEIKDTDVVNFELPVIVAAGNYGLTDDESDKTYYLGNRTEDIFREFPGIVGTDMKVDLWSWPPGK